VTDGLVGRERELSTVTPFLDRIAGGFGAMLFAGPAGIGKTTLWEAAVASARERGYRVVVSRPTEIETALAFAALNDLVGELVDDGLDDLPQPQRVALEAALLRVATTTPPQPLAVSVAVRHVIRRAAAERPLILAIDDVPWLDDPTARVLDFVLRRLDDEHVGVIAGQRVGDGSATDGAIPGVPRDRLTRVDVGPLSVDEVDRMLRVRVGIELPRPTLVRLHAVSGGNPFYALELGRAVVDRRVGDDPETLAVPPSLDALVAARLADLGPDADAVVIYASAASSPRRGLLDLAIGRDVAGAGIADAERAGVLVTEGDHLRFSHPLVAAAAYARTTTRRRREVHRRLATVAHDPEERARHLARATREPDAEVASVLEDAATAVARRGAPESAASLAERAAELTPGDERLGARRRSSFAAQQHIAAGDVVRARVLLERLVDGADGREERADALTQLAHLLLVQAEWDESRALYEEAASLVDDDPRRRVPIELGLAGVAYVTLRLADELGDPIVLFQTLGHAATWRAVLGQDWRALMDRADALAPPTDAIPAIEHPDVQFARLLRDAGELDEARIRIERLLEQAQDRGDWHGLSRLLLARAGFAARAGDLAGWETTLGEATAGVMQTGEGAWLDNVNVLAHWLAVTRGDVEGARAIQRRVRERLAVNSSLAHERWSIALGAAELEFATGDLAAAHQVLAPLLASAADDPLKPSSICALVTLGVEVLVALGRTTEAAALVDEWFGTLRGSGIGWIKGEADRAEAVLLAAQGDIGGAVARSDRSVRLAGTSGMPIIHGRALLTAGEIRRRARQKARAREALREAVAIFDKLGARLWAQRARSEMARVAPKRPEGAPLTATEREVVDLVAAGRTNREIADTLFMSVHTVEAHLTRLFRALEVQSRTELARLVIEGTDPRLGSAPQPQPAIRGGHRPQG
jgi:DNA-binding CsgD family transcriptional regulator